MSCLLARSTHRKFNAILLEALCDPSGELARVYWIAALGLTAALITWLVVKYLPAIQRAIAGVTPITFAPVAGARPPIAWGTGGPGTPGARLGPNSQMSVTFTGQNIFITHQDATATSYNLLVRIQHAPNNTYTTANSFSSIPKEFDDGYYGVRSSKSPHPPFFNDVHSPASQIGRRVPIPFGDSPGFPGKGSILFTLYVVQSEGNAVGTVYGAYQFIVQYKDSNVTDVIDIGPVDPGGQFEYP